MAAAPRAWLLQVGGAIVAPLNRLRREDVAERAVVIPPPGDPILAAGLLGEARLEAEPSARQTARVGVEAPRAAPRKPHVEAGNELAGVRNERPPRPVAWRVKGVRERRPVGNAPTEPLEPLVLIAALAPQGEGPKAEVDGRKLAGLAALIVDLLPLVMAHLQGEVLARAAA